jgi:hypothetical protein
MNLLVQGIIPFLLLLVLKFSLHQASGLCQGQQGGRLAQDDAVAA